MSKSEGEITAVSGIDIDLFEFVSESWDGKITIVSQVSLEGLEDNLFYSFFIL